MTDTQREEVLQFLSGDQIGPCRVVEVLPDGSFSHNLRVEMAGDPVLRHAVVHRRVVRDPGYVIDGLRRQSLIQHPNMARIEWIGPPSAVGGRTWFVRESLPESPYHAVFSIGTPLPAAEILQIGLAVCDLLAYVHDSRQSSQDRLVHGFLVPGYIYRTEQGRTPVTGWDVQLLVREGISVPNRHLVYRSPESLDPQLWDLTPANDLWALAGCLYHLATGRLPTGGETDLGGIRRAHRENVPQKLASQVSDEGLRYLLIRALAADARERFASARDMRDALAAILEGRNVSDAAEVRRGPELLSEPGPAPTPIVADAPFQPGDRLGQYRVVGTLSRGNYTENLRVQDEQGRDFYAGVYLRLPEDPEQLRLALLAEQALAHPGLGRLWEVGHPSAESRGRPWVIRDALPPSPWESIRHTGRPLPTDDVLEIGRQICSLFQYLHDPAEHGGTAVVHGFLVPGYIYRESDGTVKVSGFDVKLLNREAPGVFRTHYLYRCPLSLSATSDSLTVENDLWAIAGCLFYLATGQHPIDAGTREGIERTHRQGRVQARASHLSDARLRSILSRAFSPNPQDRFATADQFRAAIDAATEQSWFQPGDRLGDYKVERVLSRGSFSYNLEVKDLVGESFHAVVHLRKDISPDATIEGIRLERNLKLAGLPQIVAVGKPCEESHGRVWFAREMLPRPPAENVARTGQPLPPDEVLRIGQGVCRVLEELHQRIDRSTSRPYIHGFLVPGYVCMNEQGEVKIAGMDVQMLIRSGTEVPLRHLRYRAPEQLTARPEELTPANDLWATAACMLFLATARPPLDETLPVAEFTPFHQGAEPQARAAEIAHPALRKLLERALDPDPAKRFPSARELRQAMERALRSPEQIAGHGDPRGDAGSTEGHVVTAQEFENFAFRSDSVIAYYPAPIAVAYRRIFTQKSDHGRWLAVVAAAEALIRYLVTLALSDLLQCEARAGVNDPAWLIEADAFQFLRRQTPMLLGKWTGVLRKTADLLHGQADRRIEPLPGLCHSGSHLVTGVLDKIVEERNRWTHPNGSVVISEAEARKSLGVLRPALEEALQIVLFVCQYPLGFVRRMSDEGETRPIYVLHSCMGPRVTHTAVAEKFESPVPLITDFPFIATPRDNRILPLWPLLLQQKSELNHLRTLYVFESLEDGPRSRWLGSITAAAISARSELWSVDLRTGVAQDPGWLLQRMRQFQPQCQLPPELKVAELLMPRRGRFVGQELKEQDGTEVYCRLERMVAAGGFGTIYLAETKQGEQVAVKVLESFDTPQQIERFEREFDKLKSIQHERIITCYERGRGRVLGQYVAWYSMKFAWGGDLGNRISERGRMPWNDEGKRAEILHEFAEILEAVAHLHELSIVHRDIKPGNVLILDTGTLQLSDFGLVKNLQPSERSLAHATSYGAVLGTPDYMAPEQKAGKEVDSSADVYALGVMLAEMATGRPPPANLQVRAGSTVNHVQDLNDLPTRLRRLILRCTDVDSSQRPADARHLLRQWRDVVAALSGEGANE